jgi:hypothetical protein
MLQAHERLNSEPCVSRVTWHRRRRHHELHTDAALPRPPRPSSECWRRQTAAAVTPPRAGPHGRSGRREPHGPRAPPARGAAQLRPGRRRGAAGAGRGRVPGEAGRRQAAARGVGGHRHRHRPRLDTVPALRQLLPSGGPRLRPQALLLVRRRSVQQRHVRSARPA